MGWRRFDCRILRSLERQPAGVRWPAGGDRRRDVVSLTLRTLIRTIYRS
jgi:hypothetical protein